MSFKNYARPWYTQIIKNINEDEIPIILIGFKCELVKRVNTEEIKEFVDEKNGKLNYFEVSSVLNINTDESFNIIVQKCINVYHSHNKK